MPLPGPKVKEMCSIVKMVMSNEKSAVRADTSATRGNAREMEADTVLLLTKRTVAKIDDNVELMGHQFRIMSIYPRCDVLGSLDHYEVKCTYWTGA
jgi:hypothetical protein